MSNPVEEVLAIKPQGWWLRRPALNWAQLIGGTVVLVLAGGSLGALAAIQLSPASGSCNTTRVATAALPSVVTVFVQGETGSGSEVGRSSAPMESS